MLHTLLPHTAPFFGDPPKLDAENAANVLYIRTHEVYVAHGGRLDSS